MSNEFESCLPEERLSTLVLRSLNGLKLCCDFVSLANPGRLSESKSSLIPENTLSWSLLPGIAVSCWSDLEIREGLSILLELVSLLLNHILTEVCARRRHFLKNLNVAHLHFSHHRKKQGEIFLHFLEAVLIGLAAAAASLAFLRAFLDSLRWRRSLVSSDGCPRHPFS